MIVWQTYTTIKWQRWQKVLMSERRKYYTKYAQLEKKGLIYRDGTTRKGGMGRSQLVMYFNEKKKKVLI